MEKQHYVILETISEFGRTRALIQCPLCGTKVWAYIWSLAGSGKRCPGCGAVHTWEHGTVERKDKKGKVNA